MCVGGRLASLPAPSGIVSALGASVEPGWVKWVLGWSRNAEGHGQPQCPQEYPGYCCKLRSALEETVASKK